jgi:hypothetical protein
MHPQELRQRLAALVPRLRLHLQGKAARMCWARLLMRVFDINVERCSWRGQLPRA